MSDIVKRLRTGTTDGTNLKWHVTVTHIEAADKIERLREENKSYVIMCDAAIENYNDQLKDNKRLLEELSRWRRGLLVLGGEYDPWKTKGKGK